FIRNDYPEIFYFIRVVEKLVSTTLLFMFFRTFHQMIFRIDLITHLTPAAADRRFWQRAYRRFRKP
ncbi:MAG TPA: hypothetical protein PL169_07405, partial [Leptospiraceae bacterium]|nr:hypothetical protein [Leptospiraceae bacterium]